MNNGIIVLCILIFIIVGGLIYIYYVYEKPQEINDFVYSNITVYAFDAEKRIEIDYIIESLNSSINSSTFLTGAIQHQILVNNSFKVYNVNNIYYKTEISIQNDHPDNYRINLNLTKPGNLEIYQYGIFGIDTSIDLKTIVSGVYLDSKLCLDWSTHLIKVELENYNMTNKTIYDRCYYVGNLKDEEKIFKLKYKQFGKLDSRDFIDVYFIDSLDNKKTFKLTIPKDFEL